MGKGGKCTHWLALFCIRRDGTRQVQRRPHCPTPQKAITGNMPPTAEANRLDRERRGTGASGLLLYPIGNYGLVHTGVLTVQGYVPSGCLKPTMMVVLLFG